MRTVTMVKFMNKEELVNMLIQIKNFRNPTTGRYYRKYNTAEESWADRWTWAKSCFNMNNLDFVDPLINPDGGYVRYTGRSYKVVEMLKEEFGFREE